MDRILDIRTTGNDINSQTEPDSTPGLSLARKLQSEGKDGGGFYADTFSAFICS